MRSILCAAALAVLVSCTPQERADVVDGINAYNRGTASDWVDRDPPTDFPPAGDTIGPALIDTALKAAGKSTSIPELIAYLLGLVAVVGGGYVTRKWIQKKYNAVPK